MRDFDKVLAANLSAREESVDGLQPTASARARTWRGVRRRRNRRHAFEGVAAVAVVAVVGAVGWTGTHRDAVEPAPPVPITSSTPTAGPTPKATAAPTASAESSAPPAGLQPMPAGLLETTGPGWMLALYDATPEAEKPGTGTVVLTSPDGARYRVADLPGGGRLRLLSWMSGSSEAIVSQPGDDGYARGVLNLATGEVSEQDSGLTAPAAYLGLDFNGTPLWVEYTDAGDGGGSGTIVGLDGGEAHGTLSVPSGWASLHFNPSRTRLVTGSGTSLQEKFRAVDVANGDARDVSYGVDGAQCQVVSWYDDDHVLAACRDSNDDDLAGTWTWGDKPGHPALYAVSVTGADPTRKVDDLDADGPLPVAGSGAPVLDGVVALAAQLSSDPQCQAAYTWQDGEFSTLDAPHGWLTMRGDEGSVFVRAQVRCENEAELVAPITSTLGVGANLLGEAPEPGSGLQSWVLADGPSSDS
ncbi:hypothetical protein IC607_04620 [Cellulomonas sp. JH27-2]|uniref:hypothetical protein n=1 Tax=Cellulomonas sp. JH27-2 TaxID=2774139 RepID=UPI00177C5827|nr:hypothetical protein [Cellulomonas sp. JH27-2]MBD8058253.1 hypothetical protein [Cellulomonas sp. JH27-2]